MLTTNIRQPRNRGQLGPQTLDLPAGDRYFDQVQLWLAEPLSAYQVQQLCQLNRWPDPQRGGIHVRNRPMKYQPDYRQRLQIKQARRATLQALRGMVGDSPQLVNYVELASDHGYSGDWTSNDRDDAFEILTRCWVRKYHRPDQGVAFVSEEGGNVTQYDGPRKASNTKKLYEEDTCRTTGELHALHLEWRVSRASACFASGLATVQQLLDFDHDRFWESKLGEVYMIDASRLGRRLRNRRHGTHSRTDRMMKYNFKGAPTFSADARHGSILMSAFETVQRVIDELGLSLVRPALRPVLVREVASKL